MVSTMYKTRQVIKILNRYPELIESTSGQSAMSLEDIGGKGGLTGKAKAQKKEDLLCMMIDLRLGLKELDYEERKALFHTYVMQESTQSTPQLRALVGAMNGQHDRGLPKMG